MGSLASSAAMNVVFLLSRKICNDFIWESSFSAGLTKILIQMAEISIYCSKNRRNDYDNFLLLIVFAGLDWFAIRISILLLCKNVQFGRIVWTMQYIRQTYISAFEFFEIPQNPKRAIRVNLRRCLFDFEAKYRRDIYRNLKVKKYFGWSCWSVSLQPTIIVILNLHFMLLHKLFQGNL